MTPGSATSKATTLAWTGLGSLPFSDPEVALRHVEEHYPLAPFLPDSTDGSDMLRAVLPEGAPVSFVEGFHRVAELDPGRRAALLFPGRESAGSTPYAIGKFESRRLFDSLRSSDSPPPIRKTQIVGPVTLLTALRDERGRSLGLEGPCAAAVVPHLLGLVEIAERCLPAAPRREIWIDEPFLGLIRDAEQRSLALALIRRMLEGIRALGPKTGLHCCSKAPFDLLAEPALDLLSFDYLADARAALETGSELEDFLARGGILTLGVVRPLGFDSDHFPADDFEGLVRRMAPAGDRDLALAHLRLSPTCGTFFAPVEREIEIAARLADWCSRISGGEACR